MKVLVLASLCLLVAASAAIQLPGFTFGLCVEMCSPSILLRATGFGTCPEGQECRSNGCGHTCQTVSTSTRICGPVCAVYCPYGNVMVNGCPTCSCNPSPFLELRKVNGVTNK